MEVTIEHEHSLHTLLAWAKDEPPGTEFTVVRISSGGLWASGTGLGTDPMPYRVDYELATDADFVTTRLGLTTVGAGWRRTLDLSRAPSGEWCARTTTDGESALPPPGGDTGSFGDALDPDVELSPLFNSLPVLRHRLHEAGGSVDLSMVWVSLPALQVQRSRQRYSHLGRVAEGRVVRFDSLDDAFTAEIVLDDDGLVVEYPGIGRRLSRR
ncbi:MAG: hypothetical protein GEV10_25830 [Streptosporangiales bacterium]|nr:hypothetical protein [Streptosporangiales bacterium]